jgi:predicted nucleic acid-binding protein
MGVLQRLSAFVLNRTTNDLRSELHEYLVMMALLEDEENKGMTRPQIVTSIEKDLKVEKFPESLIKSAIGRLKGKRFVEIVHGKGGDLYLLSQDKRNKIKLMREQYSQTLTRVRKKLAEKIGEIMGTPVDMSVETLVFITFQSFLGTVLSNLGSECCFAIVGSRGKELTALKPIDIPELLDDMLRATKEVALRKAERQAFLEYISDPDDDLSDFLYSLAQSYFIIHVLHLDPECQSYTRESLQKKKVYVDTNVIVHSLTGAKKRTKAVNRALKLTSDLEIGIIFSKRTKQEFDTLVADSRRIYGKNPKVPKGRFDKFQNELKDGFLKDFLIKKKKNPNLTFDRYVDRLEEIEAVLKNRFSAICDDMEYGEIFKDPDLPKLKTIVVDEGVRFGLFKSSFVAEHDAFHILLVEELRKKDRGDVLGPNYWFLTHDRSLQFVEKKFGKYEKFPSSIFVDNWVQLISPLLAPEQTNDARDAYASLFASRLPMLTKTIDGAVFLAYQGKWMDDEDLMPNDVARVIGNRYVKDYYEKAKEEKKRLTKEERDMIIQPTLEEVKREKTEMEELKQEVASLRQTTSRLQTETDDLKSTVTGQRNLISWLGHLVGAFIFLILWFVLYQFVLIRSLEPWQALIGSIIIAAIFGYLADFHGYKWLVDRLLRYGSSEK